MNILIKVIFGIGFLFFGGGFIIALLQFIIYNGLGNMFEYREANSISIEVDSTQMPCRYLYRYEVQQKVYEGSQNISSTTARQMDTSHITIVYNTLLPSVSMIENLRGKNSKGWDYTVGMIIMGFFIVFLFCLYKFSDLDKWIGVYTRGEYKSSQNKRLESRD